MDDQKIRLILGVEGVEQVNSLQATLAAVRAESVDLAAQLARGEISHEDYARAIRDNELAQKNLVRAIRDTAAAVEQETKARRDAADAEARAATSAETFSQALERLAADELGLEVATRKATEAHRLQAEVEQHSADEASRLAYLHAKVAAEMGHVTSSFQENRAATARTADGLGDLKAKLALVEAEQARLAVAFRTGVIDFDAYQKQMGSLSATANNYRGAIGQLETATGGWTAKYRQNIQALGYAVNDFTSVSGDMSQRLNAIANNLPLLLAGFGGIGLALSGIVPIIGLVIKNWDNLKEAFGIAVDKSVDHVERLKEKIKELEDKPVKLAIDTLELENMRKEVERVTAAVAMYRSLQGQQSEAEQKSGSAIKKEHAENQGAEADKAIRSMFVREQKEQSAPLREAREKQKQAAETIQKLEAQKSGGVMDDAIDRAIATVKSQGDAAAERAKAIETEITRAGGTAETAAGDLLKKAIQGRGDEQARAQDEYRERLQRVGRGDLAGKVRGNTVAAQKEWDDLTGWQSGQDEKDEAEQEKADKKKKENDQLVKTLNQQGNEGHELAAKRVQEINEKERLEGIQGTPDRKAAAKQFDDQVKEQIKSLNTTSLDEEAVAAAARARAAGGYQDQRGRFHKRDRDEQQADLSVDLREQVSQRNPGLDQDTVRQIAHRMAAQAVEKVDEAQRQGEAQLRGDLGAQAQATGMSVNQVLGVNRDTQANQLIMAEVMRGIIANADLAAGQVQQVRQQLQMLGNGVARNGARLKTQAPRTPPGS